MASFNRLDFILTGCRLYFSETLVADANWSPWLLGISQRVGCIEEATSGAPASWYYGRFWPHLPHMSQVWGPYGHATVIACHKDYTAFICGTHSAHLGTHRHPHAYTIAEIPKQLYKDVGSFLRLGERNFRRAIVGPHYLSVAPQQRL